LSTASLEHSYRYAARLARRSGSNFFRSFRLLPPAKRQAMYALYAFARQTDDMGDAERGPGDLLAVCRNLEAWRAITARALLSGANGAPSTLPLHDCPEPLQHVARQLLPALTDAVQRFEIPSQYLLDLVDGVLADQTHTRFQSFEQLEHYCYQVAASVGLACIHIWEYSPPLPQAVAIDCGVAFQLTNILRDVREDAARDRIYLPREFWTAAGVEEAEVLAARPTPGLLRAMAELGQRARSRYRAGWEVYHSLHSDGRPMFSMMWRTYRLLQCALDRDPNYGLSRRVRLSTPEKLRLLGSHCFSPWFRRLGSPQDDPRYDSGVR
jgi:phytoene synthase